MKRAFLALLFACASQAEPPPPPPPPAEAPKAPSPPVARKVPFERKLHGETFTDDYFWLREKGSADVMSYLSAEDEYANAMVAHLEPARKQLYQEIVGHIAEDDETVPVKDGGYLYWSRVIKGRNYPVHLRRAVKEGSPEEVLLDVNALAEGKAYLGIGAFDVSDDGKRLLYSVDETGFRQYTLRFEDLETGETSKEQIEKVVMASWASDGRTVFYVVEDAAKRPHRLYRHTVGTDPKDDALVYEEKDGRFELYVWRTQSRAYMVAHSESKLQTEVRLIDAKKPASAPILVEPRSGEIMYTVEHRKDRLIIRVNDKGRNFRIVEAPVTKPGKASWKEVRPHSDAVMIEEHLVLADHLAMTVREGGLSHIDVYDFAKKRLGRVAMPEPVYEVWIESKQNLEHATTKLRYRYQSLSTPKSVYEVDLATMKSVLLKEDPVPGGFDKSRYMTERISAKAKDGTAIPISLVRRADTPKDGSAALHLVGYGSYGYAYPVVFSAVNLSLLDRGVMVAIAHIRGGGELGKIWHEQGRLANKMNTFTDFIACAEHLIAEKYTSSARLTIEGGSAGGLLMGAVVNLRPDLFKAALIDVPFVDVINTMNDPTLPLTITEYEEWGNPAIEEQYRWMRPYSPYDNLEAKAYPAMLVRTSLNDSQVMYWEPAKYVARLRTLKTDTNPLLFEVNLEASGHGGKSGRYGQYEDAAFDLAFLLSQVGAL
jgi:oligopeptidase B